MKILTGRIGEALDKRLDLSKKHKQEDLQLQIDGVTQLIKDITEELAPIREALIVLKGYLAEAKAIKEDDQLSIFDMVSE